MESFLNSSNILAHAFGKNPQSLYRYKVVTLGPPS